MTCPDVFRGLCIAVLLTVEWMPIYALVLFLEVF